MRTLGHINNGSGYEATIYIYTDCDTQELITTHDEGAENIIAAVGYSGDNVLPVTLEEAMNIECAAVEEWLIDNGFAARVETECGEFLTATKKLMEA